MTRPATISSFRKETLFATYRNSDPPICAQVIATSKTLPSIIRCRITYPDIEDGQLVLLFRDTDMSPEDLVNGKGVNTVICDEVEHDTLLALAILNYLGSIPMLPAPPSNLCDSLPLNIRSMIEVIKSAEQAAQGKS